MRNPEKEFQAAIFYRDIMNKTSSILIKARTLYLLFFIFFAITVFTLVFFMNSYFFIIGLTSARDSLFRNINSMIIEITRDEEISGSNINIEYEKINKDLLLISSITEEVFHLERPFFSDEDGYNSYRINVSSGANSFKTRINYILNRKYIILFIFALTSLTLICSVIIYMIFQMRNISFFVSNIIKGISRLDKILNYESDNTEQLSVHPSRLSELNQFNSIICRISKTILNDRSIQEIDIHGNLDDFLSFLHKQIVNEVKCDRIALAFIGRENNVIAETAFATYKTIFLQPGHSEPISDTSLKNLSADNEPRIINDLVKYAKGKTVSESTGKILREGIRSSITVPMFFQSRCIGFLFISSRQPDAYSRDDGVFAKRIAGVLKQKFYIEYLIQEVIAETSNAFITLMHEKDNETSLHITRMTEYSYIIAKCYYTRFSTIDARFVREIHWFAALHDIGKIGIPDSILLKNGKLEENEMSVMRSHVVIGERVIENMNKKLMNIVGRPVIQTAIDLIKGHHEKYDGTGYPLSLKGDNIPIAGRIVAVADVFDALTSARPYKKPYSVEESINIMENSMKGHFDPDVFLCFKNSIDEIIDVYEKYKEV